jgi:hypothetical protein
MMETIICDESPAIAGNAIFMIRPEYRLSGRMLIQGPVHQEGK